ncbi:MAG: hypothetical protein IPO77_08520 [Acidobacteria bacterium]|nr:hypothetical protein [Acidobacteriota bacterium]
MGRNMRANHVTCATSHLATYRGRVENHSGRWAGPIEEQACSGRPIKISPLDVRWVIDEIAPLAPKHGVVDVKAHGNVFTQSEFEAVIDDLPRFGVSMVERNGSQNEGQARLLPSGCSDGCDDVAYHACNLLLWCVDQLDVKRNRRIQTTLKHLKRQITEFIST